MRPKGTDVCVPACEQNLPRHSTRPVPKTFPRSARLAQLFTLAFAVSGAAACASSAPADAERVGARSDAVIRGTVSDASQDAVVLLMHIDPKANGFGECTGTMLAPNLVLTARHCVAETEAYAACDGSGKPLAAGKVYANHKPETLYVFTGNRRPDFHGGLSALKAVPHGAQIIDDGGTNLCNHDIALIVLDRPIEGTPIAPVRLETPVVKGELVTTVGWGVTEKSPQPAQRQQRGGVAVEELGPSDMVPPNEFQVGESICSGDSGGPAVASTGAVIGVVSRGGNGRQPSQNDPSAGCINGSNLFSRVSSFKDTILRAYEQAGAEPWIEGKPDPRKAKFAAACTQPSDCRSNLCRQDDTSGDLTCSQTCSDDEPCPDGYECAEEGDLSVCRLPPPPPPPTTTTTVGCSAGPSSAGGLGWIALAALGVIASRRRRRA